MEHSAAVVVGVHDCGILPKLPGALMGAKAFADWANEVCDEVYRFIDDDGPVERRSVLDQVAKLAGKVTKLFIYFSGHGLASAIDQDYWVLSRAADDPGEFVNVHLSLDNARAYSRIGHILVLADACRSLAGKDHIQATQGGSTIFPSPLGARAQADTVIDVFYATKSFEVALERAAKDKSPEAVEEAVIGSHGFFTDILLPVLRGEVPEALRPNPATGATVLYSRQLATYLDKQVPLVTGRIALVSQEPDSRPTSYHPLSIAELTPPQSADLTLEARFPNGSIADRALVSILDLANPNRPVLVARAHSGSVSKNLPQGAFYGSQALLSGYQQEPEHPNPVTLLNADQVVSVGLVRKTKAESAQPPPGPSLLETLFVDAAGRAHTKCPEDGIYTVVSHDLLSGRTASELQVVKAEAEPVLLQPLEADPKAEARVTGDVTAHRTPRAMLAVRGMQSGLVLVGTNVRRAFLDGCVLEPGDDGLSHEVDGKREAWLLRADHDGSAVLELDGERYAAATLFAGFVGSLVVGPEGVRSVAYTQSSNRGYQDEEESDQTLRLRALAEAAARVGRLDVVVDEGRPFLKALYRAGGVDPVVGILAAWGYHQRGEATDPIDALIRAFRKARQCVPRDVLLLSRDAALPRVTPSFPLLSQAWSRLSLSRKVDPVLREAGRHLTPSLWTTVRGKAGQRLGEAVREGAL